MKNTTLVVGPDPKSSKISQNRINVFSFMCSHLYSDAPLIDIQVQCIAFIKHTSKIKFNIERTFC